MVKKYFCLNSDGVCLRQCGEFMARGWDVNS